MRREVDQMLCCLLSTRAGTRLIPRDLRRFRLLEHGREPLAEHDMRGKRANDPRPVFYPDGISNKGWLALRGSLREPESATREVASIRVRDELPMPQAIFKITELAEADSSLTVTQTPFVVPGRCPLRSSKVVGPSGLRRPNIS